MKSQESKTQPCLHGRNQKKFDQECKNTALGYILAVSGHIINVCLSVYNTELKQLMLYCEKRGIDIYGQVYNKYYQNPKNFKPVDRKQELKKYGDKTNQCRQVLKGFDKKYDKKIKAIYQTSKNEFTLYLARYQAYHKGYKGFYAVKNEIKDKIISTYSIDGQSQQRMKQIREQLDRDYEHFQKFIIKGTEVPNELRENKQKILGIRDFVLQQLEQRRQLPQCLDRFSLRYQVKERQLAKQMSLMIIKRLWSLDQPGEQKAKIGKKVEEGIQRYNSTIGTEESYSRLLTYLSAFEDVQQK